MGCTEQEKVLRMVNTDKLWLDPYAPTYETIRLGLKEGSPAWVLIDMPDAPKLVRGKVLYVSPVADSVSQTRRVRVEIDNPQAWPAGTQAQVRFTEPSAEWDKYKMQIARAPQPSPSLDSGPVLATTTGLPPSASNSLVIASQWYSLGQQPQEPLEIQFSWPGPQVMPVASQPGDGHWGGCFVLGDPSARVGGPLK